MLKEFKRIDAFLNYYGFHQYKDMWYFSLEKILNGINSNEFERLQLDIYNEQGQRFNQKLMINIIGPIKKREYNFYLGIKGNTNMEYFNEPNEIKNILISFDKEYNQINLEFSDFSRPCGFLAMTLGNLDKTTLLRITFEADYFDENKDSIKSILLEQKSFIY